MSKRVNSPKRSYRNSEKNYLSPKKSSRQSTKKTIEDFGKVVRRGKVAVIISPGFGAGWYSWNEDHPELLFLPEVVKLLLDKTLNNTTDARMGVRKAIEKYIKELYGREVFTGGVGGLRVVWVPVGTRFRILEFDGYEVIILKDIYGGRGAWLTA